jgi:hypothetical protein
VLIASLLWYVSIDFGLIFLLKLRGILFMGGCLLVQQWHPDRLTRTPSLLGEAKRKFHQIQEAYAGN